MPLPEMQIMHHQVHQVRLEVILDTLPQEVEFLVDTELLVDTMHLPVDLQLPLMEHLHQVTEHPRQISMLHLPHQLPVFQHIDRLEPDLLQAISDLLVALLLVRRPMLLRPLEVVLRELPSSNPLPASPCQLQLPHLP